MADGPIDAITNPEKLNVLATSVMNKCDGIDGLVDGLIDDPRKCTFDARTDLPSCENDENGKDCFTTAQRNTIYAIYGGPKNSTGDLLTFGQAYGSEAIALNMFGIPASGWMDWIIPGSAEMPLGLNPILGAGYAQYLGLTPPPGAVYDYTTFDFDTDWSNVMSGTVTALCNATNPDLSVFKGLGGKIIHYDGWADQATGPHQSVDYYEKVLGFMGEAETKAFYKLYMIPGMGHCGGGLGCFDKDALFAALVNWVENEVMPTTYTGSGMNAIGNPRTRPMCLYPDVAVYSGTGDIDDAANFSCQTPADVISPTTGVIIVSSSVADTIDAGTPPEDFATTTVVNFTATGVTGRADFAIDFSEPLGSDPVIYKVSGTTWGRLYPENTVSGISNVKLIAGVLTFTMEDNSAFDADNTVGTIDDPLVAGHISTSDSSSNGDGGTWGCFIKALLVD
jgi:hypothetical protein